MDYMKRAKPVAVEENKWLSVCMVSCIELSHQGVSVCE